MSVIRKNNIIYMTDAIGITFHSVNAENINYPCHYHDFVEFVYILKGKCVHIVDGKNHPLKHGDMLMINYGQSHTICGDSAVEYINVYIKPEYIDVALKNSGNAFALLNLTAFEDFKEIADSDICKATFNGAQRTAVECLLSTMLNDSEFKMPGSYLSLHSALNLLLIHFFRKTSVSFDEGFDTVSNELLYYIKRNLGQKLTLTDITSKCPYNKSYFSRIFKEYTGMTFTEYLKKERIERAKELLDKTDSRVEEICSQVGYSDKTRFYKDFKSLVDMTPAQYRESKK